MIINSIILSLSLLAVIKGANLATKYSANLAKNFRLSKYLIGFIVVAFISILPEALISINSAIEGVPAFGLGTLLGSNVADLTLIFAILIIIANRGIKIESRVLKNIKTFPVFLFLPIALGLDGHFSRLDGFFLIFAGIVFYSMVFKNGIDAPDIKTEKKDQLKNFIFLILALALLLLGSHFIVTSATALAHFLKISPILIGLLIVSLGTTMPELFFSLKSVKKKDDDLAIGDILGSVLVDATLIIGLLAVISPFTFPPNIIYITGLFMIIASLILLKFMHSGKVISKKEGYLLLILWLTYVLIEILAGRYLKS